MARTHKDAKDYLKDIRKPDEVLSKRYLRHKVPRKQKHHEKFDEIEECPRCRSDLQEGLGSHFCNHCGWGDIEDLVDQMEALDAA